MLVRNISQRSNTKCRMCEEEIREILNSEIPYSFPNSIEERARLREERRLRRLELEAQHRENLYGLEGISAGGNSLETICERHLRELRDNISRFLETLRA